MNRISIMGSIALVVAVMIIFMPRPLYSAMNEISERELDKATHDYIADKQQATNCSMVQMSDSELSTVSGEGFSSFTLADGVSKAYFNIQSQTFAEIESFKMGYYNDGLSLGWDQDWTSVSLGSATEDLVCKGLYIEAKFSNISDPATRALDYLKVGTPSMTGPISATFNSFTGHIENPTDGVIIDSIRDGKRLNLGQKTITSTNSEFYMQLSRTGTATETAGWWFYWNNATIQ